MNFSLAKSFLLLKKETCPCLSWFFSAQLVFLLSLLVSLFLLGSLHKASGFEISTGNMTHTDHIAGKVMRAYKNLGIEAKIKKRSLKRSLIAAQNGIYDAELARAKDLESIFPDLIRVPYPIEEVHFVSLVKKSSRLKKLSWQDISTLYHVRPRGIQLLAQKTKGFNGEIVNNTQSIFEMVTRGRADVGLLVQRDAVKKIQNFKDLEILSPPLENVFLYHYVHKKHADLVPLLAREFERLTP